MRRILDANHEKADLNKIITKQCHNLVPKELDRLLTILRIFKELFNGILGMLNTNPVGYELKDDAMPVFSRPYPIPIVHKEMFRKEVNILVSIDVLDHPNDSEWGSLSFSQPK